MTRRIVIAINPAPDDPQAEYVPFEAREENLSASEQTELDALQAALTAQRQADETARSAIQYGADAEDIGDPAKRKALIDSHRTFLTNTAGTTDPAVRQLRRLTQGQLGILRRLVT